MSDEKKSGIKITTLVPMEPKTPRELLEKKAPPPAQPSAESASTIKTQTVPSASAKEPSAAATPTAVVASSALTPHAIEGHIVEGRQVEGRQVSEVVLPTTTPKAGVSEKPPSTVSTTATTASKAAPALKVKTAPMASIASRLADMLELDAGAPPASLRGGSTNKLHTGHFHFMIYGEPNTYKTTVAAEFGGPEHTLIIMTRRSTQLTPLARKGYMFVVAEDADALRWALLHTEKAALLAEQEAAKEGHANPGWAAKWEADPERVVIVDDVTEGTNVLKEDYMYVFNEKTGETTKIKDGRQAYKKAADELHDYLKIILGRPQHVGLVALDKSFDVEGTSDNRTEPDMPNKMMKLAETELEYVFFFPHGDRMQTKTSKVVRQAQLEGKKEMVTWNEITFAKCKLPIEYLGKGVVADMAPKNLRTVWTAVQAAMRGDWKPLQPQATPSQSLPSKTISAPVKSVLGNTPAKPPGNSTSTASTPVASPKLPSNTNAPSTIGQTKLPASSATAVSASNSK